jgi:hypothetical protein
MADETPAPAAHEQVTVSDDQGRSLTGIGDTPERLTEILERHAPPVEAPATSDQPAEKPTRGQQRFSELTRLRKEAEERATKAERELNELRGQAGPAVPAALPSGSPTTGPPPAQFVQPAPSQGRPQPSEDDIGTKYKTYADFVLDSARWVAEQELAPNIDARIRQGIEADRATRDFLAHAESTWAKGRKVYADFDTVRTTGPGAQVPMDHAKIQAILHHPATEHMQYVIAKDVNIAQRLAAMGPIEFGMAMQSFAPSGAAGSQASTASNGSSTPPAPMQPVGSSSPTTVASLSDLAAKGDYEAYRARREEDRKRARR